MQQLECRGDDGLAFVRPKIVDQPVKMLRRQLDRQYLQTLQRPLDGLVVHIVIGWDGSVFPQEPDPIVTRQAFIPHDRRFALTTVL